MNITSKQVYESCMQGAYHVIQNRELLNKINVFPIRDGDTGSNLSSMMRAILQKAEPQVTAKKTLESVADASLYGARGNSGIIFAQYFRGMSEAMEEKEPVSLGEYARASQCAAQYAYAAVEKPVEGTMITLMREWGSVLTSENDENRPLEEVFENAFQKLKQALARTKDQLLVLKKAGLVDSGAMGFTCFIEGALYYMQNQDTFRMERPDAELVFQEENIHEAGTGLPERFRYCTECLLENRDSISFPELKAGLRPMGNSIAVAGHQNKGRIHIHTDSPADVFAYLSEYGHILYQKADDMYRQEAAAHHRKYPIALVTDSIADLPAEILDEYQIHMVYLDVLFHNTNYMDRLTIHPSYLLAQSRKTGELPTFSQPSPKSIENMLDFLSTYYQSVIIMTVSEKISGTYQSFTAAAREFCKKNTKSPSFRIRVINTRQNAGAQGLLVKKCAEYIHEGISHDEAAKRIEELIPRSKILVQVQTLDEMIRSGRLSMKAGTLARKAGLKPIVTLDQSGKGKICGIAFSLKGSRRKIRNYILRVLKQNEIEQYNIVHVNNPLEAARLADSMTELTGIRPAYITETSSIVAVSAGDGAVAVSYLLKKRGGK